MPDTRLSALLLFAVLPACLDAAPPPEVGSSAQEANVNVVWVNGENVSISGNTLTKSAGGNAWNAGASSVQTIGGHGWVRFGVATDETNTFRMVGLSRVNPPSTYGDDSQSYADIDYGIMLTNTGGASIYEGGSFVETAGDYADTDQFYVEVTPTQIIYRKNLGPDEVILHTTDIDLDADPDIFPLQVDTSLKTAIPAATIGNVVINEDPKIHVGVQQDLFSGELRCGVGDTIVLNEAHFEPIDAGACGSEDFSAFDDVNPYDVESNLENYAGTIGLDPARADIIVTLDLEHPGADNIWGCVPAVGDDIDHDSNEQDLIIRGLKNRIIGTRLAFPNAKLSLFPSLVPDAKGTWSGRFQDQVDAIQAAAAASEGLFDTLAWNTAAWGAVPACEVGDCPCPEGACRGLDYFLPVLFTRFGCDDEENPANCDEEDEWGITPVTAYTTQAIEAADEIGSGLPLLPFFSTRVQSNSQFGGRVILDLGVGWQTALDETLRVSLPLLEDAGVDDVVLWKGGYPDNIVRDGTPPIDNKMCWDASHTQMNTCASYNPNSTNYVTMDDYTCWL